MRGSAWRIGLGAWVALLAMACGACCFALTPSPSPAVWEGGVPDRCRLLEWAVSGARMLSLPSPLIPIARPKFTNCCACRIPPLPALSPLVKGGEGRGEGGFEADGFINSGSAIGITPLPRCGRREQTIKRPYYPTASDRYPTALDRYPTTSDRYPTASDRYPTTSDRYPTAFG
jgi:hypothetical protein